MEAHTSKPRSRRVRLCWYYLAFVCTFGILVGVQVRLLWSPASLPSRSKTTPTASLRHGTPVMPHMLDGIDRLRNRSVPFSITPDEQARRQHGVKQAMQFAWTNYVEHGFGGDEIDTTLGANRSDVWGDIACSMVDGMDTLWLMGLKDEFAQARAYVDKHLTFEHLGNTSGMLSVFETTIREVGGLLSAFALTNDPVFRNKAQDLVDRLMPAFDPKSGVFAAMFNPYTKERGFPYWNDGNTNLADAGSLQLELRYLTDITGNASYAAAGDAFYSIILREGSYRGTGLFPTLINPENGHFVKQSKLTFGALADSFYEYLLKVFIYGGKRKEDDFLRDLYDDAIRGLDQYILRYADDAELFYLQEVDLPWMEGQPQMEHLACFAAGMLVLGTLHDDDVLKNARHLRIAKQLGETCFQMYHRQPTGLSPESMMFPTFNSYNPTHHLRPEVVESLFYLYRATKDERYRQQGWEIFTNLERHAKTLHGFSTVDDVTQVPAQTSGRMESFFLAETLKYHYLLQAPEDVLSLDEFVFNTEAHPLRIRREPSLLY